MSAGTSRGDNVVAFPGRTRALPTVVADAAPASPTPTVIVRDHDGVELFTLDAERMGAPFAAGERERVRRALRHALELLDTREVPGVDEVRGALAHFHLALPLAPSLRPEEEGVVLDAAGREAFTVDQNGERPDREASGIARILAVLVNGLAGYFAPLPLPDLAAAGPDAAPEERA